MQDVAQTHGIRVTPELTERVRSDQLRIVWSHITVGSVIATVFAVALAAYLAGRIGAELAYGWLAIKLGAALPRVVQAQYYRHTNNPGTRSARFWTYLLLALDGVAWGLIGIWTSSFGNDTSLFVITCLASVAAVATFGLQVRMLATVAYVGPMIGLTALALLARLDEFGAFLGSGLLLFLAVLVTTALRSERSMFETFLLREYNEQLAKERQAALELADKHAEESDQALEEARRKSAVKTQFLANISHELRTPLHGILGVTRLLHAETTDTAVHRRLDLIETAGSHLLQLINDLLDISRIEHGNIPLTPAPFDLRAELARVADMYRLRAEEKGLRLHTEIDLPQPAVVSADALRLRQILHNLLGNAIKFTDRGYISLSVRHRAPQTYEFEVRDTGRGISDEDRVRVFDKFVQLERDSRAAAEGSGLGLTIARELAQAMGGDIRCISTKGLGSCFTLTVDLPASSQPLPSGVTSIEDAQGYARRRELVLLAEDNRVNAVIATTMLERMGLVTEHVGDGDQVVEAALRSTSRPALVLMDIRLPSQDGYAAARAIRAGEAALGLPRIPIIALTASAGDEGRRLCLEAGMDAFLAKPFEFDEFISLIGGVLKRAATQAAALPTRHSG
jgi:signal transduction histidine kinase/FixJ family two-component response regulator